jgi:hypothetical protein
MKFQETRDIVTRVEISPVQPEQRYNSPAPSSNVLLPLGVAGPTSRQNVVIVTSSTLYSIGIAARYTACVLFLPGNAVAEMRNCGRSAPRAAARTAATQHGDADMSAQYQQHMYSSAPRLIEMISSLLHLQHPQQPKILCSPTVDHR